MLPFAPFTSRPSRCMCRVPTSALLYAPACRPPETLNTAQHAVRQYPSQEGCALLYEWMLKDLGDAHPLWYCRICIIGWVHLRLAAQGDGALTVQILNVSPFLFFLPLTFFPLRSSAWIMALLMHAKESTRSVILPASMKHRARSESSAAMSAARSIPLRSKSRLIQRELKSRTAMYASTTSGK